MSMDTDAEDAFKKGSRWFFKRDADKSGSSTPRNKETELSGVMSLPLPLPLPWRGSWPSIFHGQGTNYPPTAAGSLRRQGETVSQNVMPPSSPSISNRIPPKSVISSPLNSLRYTATKVVSRPGSEYGTGNAQGNWSSDSASSDEELPWPEWRASKHQLFHSLVNIEDVDDTPNLSSPDDEADDKVHDSLDVAAGGADSNS